jgi:hypothetical protein
MTSVLSPMRRSSCLATGSAAQPASWPWVIAIAFRTPAFLSTGVISPSGAEAPKITTSAFLDRASPAARRRTSGPPIISEVGCLTTSNGWAASKAASPSHFGA